jgi:hypothetical protein
MLDNKYGCVPMLEQGVLAGILTEADFVRHVAEAALGTGSHANHRTNGGVHLGGITAAREHANSLHDNPFIARQSDSEAASRAVHCAESAPVE